MSDEPREEFYIGYLSNAPRNLAKLVRRICLALFGLVVLTAILLALGQQKLSLSVFEFQQYRDFTGLIQAQPNPTLLVRDRNSLAQYLLVAEGKHGVNVENFTGKNVKLKGARIYRDGMTMIEVVGDSIEILPTENKLDLANEDLGNFTLVGEIVDSKCYLGVMNPGSTKVHRECAVRCISGGIPPLFIARDAVGNKIALQLVSAKNEAVNQDVLDFVAEPIKITGQVSRTGEQLIFKADPKTYQRVE